MINVVILGCGKQKNQLRVLAFGSQTEGGSIIERLVDPRRKEGHVNELDSRVKGPGASPVNFQYREVTARETAVRKKIIAFDSWTEGLRNLERFVGVFSDQGLDLSLLHIGSWGHDQGRPAEEIIKGVPVRDISYFKESSFLDILKHEKPSLVILQSLQPFAHRAFKRYCDQLGIPTIHVYHGLVSVLDPRPSRNSVNMRRQASLFVSRISQNLSRVLPIYGRALWDTNADLRDWGWFVYDIWRKIVGSSYGEVAAPDSSTTACCVYTEADLQHAKHRYRLSTGNVAIVGNPDLDRFGLTASDLGRCLTRGPDFSQDVVYIDTALLHINEAYPTAQSFVNHLVSTKDVLARSGLRLVVKLHPAHLRTTIPAQLERSGVSLSSDECFLEILRRSRGAIVEPSSAALIPALLGLPLLLARYGSLATQGYGEALTTYPRAREVFSLEDVLTILMSLEREIKEQSSTEWIEHHAGPLPSQLMPTRVADVCNALIGRVEKVPHTNG